MNFTITRGKRMDKGIKVVVYGPEGIGKSTFAAAFPDPLFIDTEGSTSRLDVSRLPDPDSWTQLIEEIGYIQQNPQGFRTFVIDTADWAEQLLIDHIVQKYQKGGIEDFGYGKGYTYVAEEFGKMLGRLSALADSGMNIVLVCHCDIRTFTQPDDLGQYDRYNLKLSKKDTPLLMEWCDALFFVNYETIVVEDRKSGKKMGKGGNRVMYTQHTPAFDAKNRFDLQPKLPFEFSSIASLFTDHLTTDQLRKIRNACKKFNVETSRLAEYFGHEKIEEMKKAEYDRIRTEGEDIFSALSEPSEETDQPEETAEDPA